MRHHLDKIRMRVAVAACFGTAGLGTHHSAYATYLGKLKLGVRTRMRTNELHTSSIISVKRSNTQNLVSRGQIMVVADSESTIASTPLWQQGDEGLSTDANYKKRLRLKNALVIRDVLHAWWQIVHKMPGWVTRIRTAEGFEEALTREGYVEIFLRVFKALIEEWDEGEAMRTIAEDWEGDVRDANGLVQEQFFDSLFE